METHENDLETVPGVPEWNPLAELVDTEIPLAASGGRATVRYRRWTGRERLAYEDAITQRLLTTDERTGDDTVKIGSLRLFAATLTIRGSSGFPVEGFLAGGRDKVESDLLSITDRATYDEILRTALDVQPLPSADRSGKGGDGVDEDDEDGPDPSTTSRTHPTRTDDVVESGSPVE